jgi:hypothetical protein
MLFVRPILDIPIGKIKITKFNVLINFIISDRSTPIANFSEIYGFKKNCVDGSMFFPVRFFAGQILFSKNHIFTLNSHSFPSG